MKRHAPTGTLPVTIATNRHGREGRTRKRTARPNLPAGGRPLQTVVIPTERGTAAATADAARKLLQCAENVLLDPRAGMWQRGEIAAEIAVFLAETEALRARD